MLKVNFKTEINMKHTIRSIFSHPKSLYISPFDKSQGQEPGTMVFIKDGKRERRPTVYADKNFHWSGQ